MPPTQKYPSSKPLCNGILNFGKYFLAPPELGILQLQITNPNRTDPACFDARNTIKTPLTRESLDIANTGMLDRTAIGKKPRKKTGAAIANCQ